MVQKNREDKTIQLTMTTKVHFMVIKAIRNPPKAWPETDAIRNVA